MATEVASGTLNATVGTEHTVWEDTAANGTYQWAVNLSNLAAGEIVELRVYRRILGTDTAPTLYLVQSYSGPVADPVVVSTPVLTTKHIRFTLKQVNGTGRSYPWVVEKA